MCSVLIHLPMDLPQLPANLCSLMDTIIPYVHSCEEAQGRWQSQDGLEAAFSVYLRSLSSVWGLEMDVLLSPCWERPAELCELGPCGRCHLPSLHLLFYHFFIFYPFVCCFSNLAEYWAYWPPPHPLCHFNLFHHFFHPSILLSLAFKGQAASLLAPHFPFDWPNSLFTSPRHKRHQADWSAGRSQGTADQWGLGQKGGGGYWREDGWREAREEKGGRRPGQVGWQTHNQRTNRWELLLSSDKRAQPVQDTQADPHWQELLFPMLMSFMLL